MELEEQQDPIELHAERITISGGRYLIFYTFTKLSEEDQMAVTDSEESKGQSTVEKG